MKIINKLIKIVVFSFLIFSSSLYSQAIVVDPVGENSSTDSLEELIENVLISGGCATVNNFKSSSNNGSFKSYGYFTNTNKGFPFENGIILSTGSAKTAEGPNNTEGVSGGEMDDGWGGDTDIETILDTRFSDKMVTQNATYVQFDFIPKNKNVSFNYIFASEEWESGGFECPQSTDNVQDGFAFLIKGPGILPDIEFQGKTNEWKNIALIPETTVPVSIGTIYNYNLCIPQAAYSQYYKSNSPIGGTAAEESAIQFSAQTTVLKVDMVVVPDKLYTLKLVIADRGDTQYDSAVFLEAGSFNLGIDIGDDFTVLGGNALCEGDVLTLDSKQDPSMGAFQWKKLVGSDFENMPGENGTSYEVSESGTYKLEIEISSNCFMEGEIIVEFADKPAAPAFVTDYIACDPDNDGQYSFNLSTKDAEILNGQSTEDFQVRYFPDEAALIADTGELSAANYINSSSQETIWARIENKQAIYCYDTVSFKLVLYESALPRSSSEITPLVFCDNTAVGSVTDGKIFFDLTQRSSEILNGQNTGFSLEFYTDALMTALSRIVDPVNFENTVVGGQTIYVKMVNDLTTTCSSDISFVISVEEVPIVPVLSTINQCDNDGVNDKMYSFNFGDLKNTEVLNGQSASVFDITYYTSEVAANTLGLSISGNYTNTLASEIIWVRIHNRDKTDCFVVSSFLLNVYPMAYPKASEDILALAYCDNLSSGSDSDGKITFDLTEKATEVLNGQEADFSLSYYTDVTFSTASQILTPETYTNSTIGSEIIYVKMSGAFVNCEATTSFEVVVNPLPVVNDIVVLKQCDNDSDGISDFNLEEANSILSANYQNELFYYYLEKSAAEQDVSAITNTTIFTSGIATVWARVVSEDNCYRIAQVDLIVSVTSALDSFFVEYEQCDDALDGDNTNGVSTFDFSDVENQILTGGYFPVGQQPIISFYENETNALAEKNKIEDIVNYRNTGSPNEQDIYVRVDSGLNNHCIGFGPHVKLIVNKVPEVSIDKQGVVCLNDLPTPVWVHNIDPLLSYKWTDEDGIFLGTGSSIEINNGGDYTVVAIDAKGCESSPKTITMMVSEKAILTLAAITVSGTSKNSSISIDVSILGDGEYEYTLNEIDGDYQDEPYFGNVTPGIHMLYVRDKNLCGIAQIEVSVLGFPKFFTPNNDGFNDYWNIKGLRKNMYSKATVSVFDRFGKLLKTFDDSDIGWDGSFNGYSVPSSDYWYVITLIDLKGESKIVKGNFSLIRRKNE